MSHRVYYRPDGCIWGHDNLGADDPLMYPDARFVMVDHDLPDRKTMMVDVASGEVRPMTPQERAQFNLPSCWDLTCLRQVELMNTDWREFQRQDNWIAYRQKLRDITKAGDVAAMVSAWPLRPDGTDAIAHFKADMHG